MEKLTEAELARIAALVDGDPEPETTVTAAELAGWLGLTASRVNAAARQGVLPRHGKSFPLRRAVAAYCEHARKGAMGRTADAALSAEKLRLARESADKVALQNAKARGELVASSEVARTWGEIVTDLRAAVLAIPSRVASRAGLDRRATAALDAEIRSALEAIADDT